MCTPSGASLGAQVQLYALHSNGGTWQSDATSSTTSAIPTGLVDGVTAVSIPEIDNAVYGGATSGDAASLLSSISDSSNWSGSNSTRQSMPAGPFGVDGVAACVQPEVAGPTLLITEYVEGSSFNKALELTNTGTSPVDLGALGVQVIWKGPIREDGRAERQDGHVERQRRRGRFPTSGGDEAGNAPLGLNSWESRGAPRALYSFFA